MVERMPSKISQEIQKDGVKIIVTPFYTSACALPANKVIVVSSEFKKRLTPEAFEFILLHEFAHIRSGKGRVSFLSRLSEWVALMFEIIVQLPYAFLSILARNAPKRFRRLWSILVEGRNSRKIQSVCDAFALLRIIKEYGREKALFVYFEVLHDLSYRDYGEIKNDLKYLLKGVRKMGFKGCVFNRYDILDDWSVISKCHLRGGDCEFTGRQPECAHYTEIKFCAGCGRYLWYDKVYYKKEEGRVIALVTCDKCGYVNEAVKLGGY